MINIYTALYQIVLPQILYACPSLSITVYMYLYVCAKTSYLSFKGHQNTHDCKKKKKNINKLPVSSQRASLFPAAKSCFNVVSSPCYHVK